MVMIDDTRIRGYFEQFVGEEPNNGNIVIYSDDDMQRFETDMRQKWHNEHHTIIQEWRDMEAEQLRIKNKAYAEGFNYPIENGIVSYHD